MADSAVAITAGLGTSIDTRTEATNGNHRQVVVLGDPSTNAGVAPVSATAGLSVTQKPDTFGGYSSYHLVAASSTNAQNVKGSAGQLYGAHVFNAAVYAVHVKFHNVSSAPTPGSGVVRTLSVQGGQRGDLTFPAGVPFTNGIGITITKLLADADTTAVVAGDCVVDVEFA